MLWPEVPHQARSHGGRGLGRPGTAAPKFAFCPFINKLWLDTYLYACTTRLPYEFSTAALRKAPADTRVFWYAARVYL